MTRIGSLFSGAGGLDLAVETVFGGHTLWHSENDPAAAAVLAKHWPRVPNLGDITQIDWAAVPPVDILCGGFPCQDVSAAGRRAGITHGTRSGLWAYMADAIAALRPPVAVIENVRGLLNAKAHRTVESTDPAVGNGSNRPVLRAAGAVCGDLADLGYDTQWATVSASSIGAPHRRGRVFILAADADVTDADTTSNRRDEGRPEPARLIGGFDAAVGGAGPVELLPTPTGRDGKGGNPNRLGGDDLPGALLPTPEAKNAHAGPDYARMSRGGSGGHDLVTALAFYRVDETHWGRYQAAITRWENLTRPAPSPTEPNTKGNPRLAAAFSEWMLGWPAGWVTGVPGISRNDALRIVGNGVVPQQAVAAITRLLAVQAIA